MEQKRLCPYCMGELPHAADSCVHCGKVFAGRNPAGCLPVGTVLAGRYTVGEMRSLDGEGILYRGVENLGCFRVTIKEYLPVTLSAERGADCILQPKTGSEVLFKTTRMDFADLYRALERITPATGSPRNSAATRRRCASDTSSASHSSVPDTCVASGMPSR